MEKVFTIKVILLLIIIQAGCRNIQSDSKVYTKEELDSFSMEKYGKSHDDRVKEMVNETMSKAMLDTIGLSKSPIKVTKARLFKQEYSSYRDIRLTFKNVSSKKISAIKFQWKGVNAFGEPADMGGPIEGFGGGFTDKIIYPKKSLTLEWSILSRDGKKVDIAWPTEVVFVDGSKWKIGK